MIPDVISNAHKGWLVYARASEKGTFKVCGKRYDIDIEYLPNAAFGSHKFLYRDSEYIILFDGVAFNRERLLNSYVPHSWELTVKSLWEKYGPSFPNEIKGSFSGFVFDIRQEKITAFGDHIGSKAVYYSYDENLIVSSDITKIYDLKREKGQRNVLDINSAYCLLACGYMLDNNTLCKDVKRMTPGCAIAFGKTAEEKCFFRLDNCPDHSITERDAVESIEDLFKIAVSNQYNSELITKEGYLTALSGGLDSRMTSLVAHKLGFTRQLNITFSQSSYLDETIARDIASDYGHDWLFKSLDTGRYLTDVEEVTEYTGGNVLYYGLSHGNSLLKLMDLSRYGILHSGQLGDVIIGTYYSTSDPSKPYTIQSGAFGSSLLSKIDPPEKTYPNEEIGKFYNRGYNGILVSGHTLVQQHIETASPFLDRDFMSFCLKMPLKFRRNHYIYKKWILSKHPDAAKYKWEKIKARIDAPALQIRGRNIPIATLPKLIRNKIERKLNRDADGLSTKHHMNPITYHIAHNPEVQKFIDNYYTDTIERVNDTQLQHDLTILFTQGSSMEKIMAVSLLSAIKRFDFK